MTVLIGNFSLSLAVMVSLVAVIASLAAARFESAGILRAARWTIAILFALLTAGSIALLVCLVQSDFELEYVARYTERALPIGYKLAAFWAGQEGSLLLWAWLLAGMSTIAAFTLQTRQAGPSGPGRASRKHPDLKVRLGHAITEHGAVLVTLSVVCGFFAALMLFAANPFKVLDVIPADGHGLNPMLQDPAMIAHPPTLFVGYAGYTIPFALLIGALVARRRDNEWIASTRRWAMVSWLFLSIGILLGAQWAYVELGWGGYWAWDPVENASLLPWLTGTALLHSIMVQQHRGMFKKWNAALIAGTFILCIFGTYITRSGVIDSVHSFGKSLIGTFFFWFLVISILFSVILLIVRRQMLRAERELEGLIGKEGFFLATNVLLVGMTAITMVGTMFPVISRTFAGQQITVSPSFYNKVVAPLGMVLVALMTVGPLLTYGKDAGARLLRGAIVPTIFGATTTTVACVLGLRSVWGLLATGIIACGLASVLVDLAKSIAARANSHNENPVSALIRVLDSNHRRYGAQTVHVGMLMIVIGITFSSLFEQKHTYSMKPGESVEFAGRTLTLVEVKPIQAANFEAAQAVLSMTDSKGVSTSLNPQIRKYAKWEQLNSEVSIQSNLREDVYVTLAAVDRHGGVTIQAIVNPLVSWIWIGGIVLTVGAVVGLLPRLLPVKATTTVKAVRPANFATQVPA
jgi:cytochrome c-type biogenesis protein CcmF